MSLKLEHKNPCIVSFNYNGKNLLDLINNNIDTMQSPNNSYGFNFSEDKRLQLHPDVIKTNEILYSFEQYLVSQKQEIIETLVENSDTEEWVKGRSNVFSEEAYVYLTPFLYIPGFSMGPHIDNKAVIAAGYLNLDDNESVTNFHGKDESEIVYTCSGEKNKGYLWLNTKDSLHSVDLVTKPRKIVIITLVWARI